MELGTIRQINIDTEMQASYLDYAMSVIVSRALPDVRDGLKPVHRRILYAMHDLGLTNDKPYKKSARIVGEVLGKYHPHGDAAVYEAMVRMAQDFSLRCPLVDGQGNFGSIDGDNAAAMRYTEARLAAISAEMLNDIDKDTVDWTENFDGTLKEPTVLPAALPNLLVNGASGIAVGMSTNIPPHNLGEVCDALCFLIDNYKRVEDVTVEDLMAFIPGPDFPTGGVIYRYRQERRATDGEQVDVIAKAYASGRGRIVVQAKAHIEEMSRNRNRIVVTELPYQANKTNLLERIADLARDGRIEGITDLRDESDRTGMRICIELTRNVNPREVLARLFKLTPLQTTFGVSLLALVDGEPVLLSLKRILMHFLEHRQEVIQRRARYDLEKARHRAHIVEGLLRALDVLDQVIATIRKSRTADTARRNLMSQFKFTEIQAQAILEMQLRRLAALERRKLQDEFRGLIRLIRELESLLASPKKVLGLIKQDLSQLKARYADPRRSQIADRTKGTLTAMDVLPDQDVWITLAADGTLARQAYEAPSPGRLASLTRGLGGKDSNGSTCGVLVANTRDDLILFSAKGQAVRVAVHQIPEGGAHFADLGALTRRDRVIDMQAFPKTGDDGPPPGFLLMGTAQGKVKRVTVADLLDAAYTDPQVIGLDDGDELAWTDVSPGEGEVLLVTANGQAIRFAEDEVRAMGLPAGGIGGIKLKRGDRVLFGGAIRTPAAPDLMVAIVTSLGYAKRVGLADFPTQGRNGQGVVAAKLSARVGRIAGAALLLTDDYLLTTTDRGVVKVVAAASIPEMGRPAQGRPVLRVAKGAQITHVQGIGASAVTPLAPRATGVPRASKARSSKTRSTSSQARSATGRSATAKRTATSRSRSATAKSPPSKAAAKGRSRTSATKSTTTAGKTTRKKPAASNSRTSAAKPAPAKKTGTSRSRSATAKSPPSKAAAKGRSRTSATKSTTTAGRTTRKKPAAGRSRNTANKSSPARTTGTARSRTASGGSTPAKRTAAGRSRNATAPSKAEPAKQPRAGRSAAKARQLSLLPAQDTAPAQEKKGSARTRRTSR